MNSREQAIKAMQALPAGATIEDALDRLLLLDKIERGLKQAQAGELASQEEAK